MIKVTFKTPQLFLANVDQGGCFELIEFVGKESDFCITKYLCYFNYVGLKFSFLYSSIETLEKKELIEYGNLSRFRDKFTQSIEQVNPTDL